MRLVGIIEPVHATGMSGPSDAELLREYLDALCQSDPGVKLPNWKNWCRLRRAGMALGTALTLIGCGGETDQENRDGHGGSSSESRGGANGTSFAGTTSPATLYGIVMGGGAATGGSIVRTTSQATGGFTSVPIYGVAMGGSAPNPCSFPISDATDATTTSDANMLPCIF